MYFITTKRMLEVCFSAHPNIQYRTDPFSLTGYRARTACVDRIIQPYRVCAGGNSLPSEGVCGCGKDGGNRQLYFLPSGAAF